MKYQTMTAKQLAARLDGREYLKEITPEEEREAEANGLVVVYGYSDDNVELAGSYYVEDLDAPNRIRAVWCSPDTDFSWAFETDIPHETFRILEDGEHFCLGIVFALEDLT